MSLCDLQGCELHVFQMESFLNRVDVAVAHGQIQLAKKLVEEAQRRGGFGFNFLHKEVFVPFLFHHYLNNIKPEMRDKLQTLFLSLEMKTIGLSPL